MARRLATPTGKLEFDVPRLVAALGIAIEYEDRGELYARCPFPWHADEKPSWSIRNEPGSPRHGRHHCFSCNGGGGPIGLVKDVLELAELDDARDWLLKSGLAGVEAPPEEVKVEVFDPLDVRRGAFRLPLGVVQKPLSEWPERVRRYVLDDRRLEPWQVERWEVGYGTFGRCVGRIVLPVRDAAGELVSYQARAFDGRDKDPRDPRPKYLTPDRSENPGAFPVFGAHLWQGDERLVIAEGALKSLACERAGELNVGAILGSNVAPEHVLLLQRFKQVVLVKDGGQAGDGVLEQVQASLGRWRKFDVVEPPEGHDADSMDLRELAQRLEVSR